MTDNVQEQQVPEGTELPTIPEHVETSDIRLDEGVSVEQEKTNERPETLNTETSTGVNTEDFRLNEIAIGLLFSNVKTISEEELKKRLAVYEQYIYLVKNKAFLYNGFVVTTLLGLGCQKVCGAKQTVGGYIITFIKDDVEHTLEFDIVCGLKCSVPNVQLSSFSNIYFANNDEYFPRYVICSLVHENRRLNVLTFGAVKDKDNGYITAEEVTPCTKEEYDAQEEKIQVSGRHIIEYINNKRLENPEYSYYAKKIHYSGAFEYELFKTIFDNIEDYVRNKIKIRNYLIYSTCEHKDPNDEPKLAEVIVP
jgi:hypothetical protein